MRSEMLQVERRLARLEAQNRFLKRVVCAVVLVGGGVLLVGQSAAPQVAVRRIEAQEIILVDGKGKERARLETFEGSMPELRFYDHRGTERLALGLRKEDANSYRDENDLGPGLILFHRDGRDRVLLRSNSQGSPGLFLWDAKGEARAVVGETFRDHRPAIELRNANGEVVFSAP